ncbi:MAG: hypothetical protein AAFV43_05420 [Planctomycetota bacterium]
MPDSVATGQQGCELRFHLRTADDFARFLDAADSVLLEVDWSNEPPDDASGDV